MCDLIIATPTFWLPKANQRIYQAEFGMSSVSNWMSIIDHVGELG